MRTSKNLYTIRTGVGEAGATCIETVITKGLYRFSILGINQKQASDAKDRVYSALRTSDLLNLKSDNRKITVNMLPSGGMEYDHAYDLPIALSCLQCIGALGVNIQENTLAIGELSIRGDIISSGRMLQALQSALTEGIKVIVCSLRDAESLSEDMISITKQQSIRFVTGQNLGDIARRMHDGSYHVFANNTPIQLCKVKTDSDNINELLEHETVRLTFLALCGRHDMAFESGNATFVEDFIREVCSHGKAPTAQQRLHMAGLTKDDDAYVDRLFSKPEIFLIDGHLDREGLHGRKGKSLGLLGASVFGNLLIPNMTDMPKNVLSGIMAAERGQIFAICRPCPCGVETIPFSGHGQKCSCIQRSILRHQQYLQTCCKDAFSIWLRTTGPMPRLTAQDIELLHRYVHIVLEVQFDRHVTELGLKDMYYEDSTSMDYVNDRRNPSSILDRLDSDALALYESVSRLYNQGMLHKILRLSQTIHDSERVISKKPSKGKSTAIDKRTVLLALSYIPKMDS